MCKKIKEKHEKGKKNKEKTNKQTNKQKKKQQRNIEVIKIIFIQRCVTRDMFHLSV